MKSVKEKTVELVEQAKVLYSLDKYEDALVLLKRALSDDPYYQGIYETMCICYIMLDKYKEARTTMNKYLMLDKKSGMAHFHLGNISLLEGKPEEAKSYYSKAELLGYSDKVMYLNMASYYEDNGENDRAISQYSKLLRIDPYDYTAMERKTQLLLRCKKYDEALQSAKEMVSTDIDRFEGHHYTYVSLILTGKTEDARTYIDDMLKRFPDNLTVKFDSVRLYDMVGDAENALKFIEDNFSDFDEIPQVATLKLGLLLQTKRVDEAIAFVEANSILLEDDTALAIMYTLYFGLEKYDKALEYCERIEKLGEKSEQYYATKYFRPLAEKKLGEIEKSKAGFAKSSEELKKLCIKHAANINLYMYRALCEYQLENYEEAKQIIEYVVAVAPENAVFYQAAAEIYEANGDTEEAKEAREKAEKLDSNVIPPLM